MIYTLTHCIPFDPIKHYRTFDTIPLLFYIRNKSSLLTHDAHDQRPYHVNPLFPFVVYTHTHPFCTAAHPFVYSQKGYV